MTMENRGIGTRLRLLLAAMDGGVQAAYDAAGVDFRPRFFAVARHLIAHGDTGVGELAQALSVSQPAVTQTLAEMRRAGLVTLHAATGDRRARIARLTPEALAMIDRLRPIWAAVARAAAALDETLPAPLGAVLDAALDALDQTPFDQRIAEQMERP